MSLEWAWKQLAKIQNYSSLILSDPSVAMTLIFCLHAMQNILQEKLKAYYNKSEVCNRGKQEAGMVLSVAWL